MIIWGTQYIRQYEGRVADFCPACREVRPFELTRIGLARHIWYISITSGRLLAHEARCEECGATMEVDRERYLEVPTYGGDLEELIATTNPNVREEHRETLELVKRAERGEAEPDEREALIAAAVDFHAARVDAKKEEPLWHLAGRARDGFWVALIVGVLSGYLFTYEDSGVARRIAMWGTAACVGIVSLLVYVRRTRVARLVRREVMPQLARALAPVDPDEGELENVLQRQADAGHTVGTAIDPHELLARVQARRVKVRR